MLRCLQYRCPAKQGRARRLFNSMFVMGRHTRCRMLIASHTPTKAEIAGAIERVHGFGRVSAWLQPHGPSLPAREVRGVVKGPD